MVGVVQCPNAFGIAMSEKKNCVKLITEVAVSKC